MNLKNCCVLILFMLVMTGGVLAQEETPEATQEAPFEFPEPGSYTILNSVAGAERSFRVTIPALYPDSSDPLPMVIILHGASGTGAWMERFTGFNELAESEGFIAVYPDGIQNRWNINQSGQTDDVAFIEYILDFLKGELRIDAARVYATGYSNGGMMSFMLGCEVREQFAAIASVAAQMPEYFTEMCDLVAPLPVLLIHGTEDNILPWAGLPSQGRGLLSASQTVRYWADHNSCNLTARIIAVPDRDREDNTRIFRESYAGCDASVALYGIYGGGHTWPSHTINAPFELGATSRDIDATEVIWAFFSRQSN